jgi:hypothetical protein
MRRERGKHSPGVAQKRLGRADNAFLSAAFLALFVNFPAAVVLQPICPQAHHFAVLNAFLNTGSSRSAMARAAYGSTWKQNFLSYPGPLHGDRMHNYVRSGYSCCTTDVNGRNASSDSGKRRSSWVLGYVSELAACSHPRGRLTSSPSRMGNLGYDEGFHFRSGVVGFVGRVKRKDRLCAKAKVKCARGRPNPAFLDAIVHLLFPFSNKALNTTHALTRSECFI